jgi:hypothetical protein
MFKEKYWCNVCKRTVATPNHCDKKASELLKCPTCMRLHVKKGNLKKCQTCGVLLKKPVWR